MDSPDATEVRSWIHSSALFWRYSAIHERMSLPLPPWWECELRQKAGRRRVGRCCVFYCRVWRKWRASFPLQLQCRLENIRSLCDVRQNQQQAFLTGQIRGSIVQHAAYCPLPQTQSVNGFIQYKHSCWLFLIWAVWSVENCGNSCIFCTIQSQFTQRESGCLYR